MSTLVAPVPASLRLHLGALAQSRWLWCLTAIAYIATIGIGYHGKPLGLWLGDTDDATRLLQVRAWMAGAGWYDLTLERLGGATPLPSHWSRLLDVPLAFGMTIAGLVVTPDKAEVLVRAVWPALVLLVLLRVLALEADRRAGSRAAAAVVVLAITAMTGLHQFKSGRIDHHNVMILATIAGLLLAARSFDAPHRAGIAGAVLGAGLVIGYEPLALVVPLGALAACCAAWTGRHLKSLRMLFTAMTAALACGVLVSRPPSAWLGSVCDAISLNLVLLAASATAGLAAVEHLRAAARSQRLFVLGLAGLVGGSLYVAANTDCLAGPYGALSADAKRLWLADVVETQSIVETLLSYPLVALAFLLIAALGAAAGWLRARHECSNEATATLAVLAAAIIAALLQMKFVPYATFIAVLVLAVHVGTRAGSAQLSPAGATLLGVILVNQLTLSIAAMPLAMRIEAAQPERSRVLGHGCETVPALGALNQLPAGLVAAPIDFGPFIAAASHHRALAAPYHRIGDRMVDVTRAFTATPSAAEAVLRANRVAYVLHCVVPAAAGQPIGFGLDVASDSLAAHLARGMPPAFLERVILAGGEANLHIYRVLPR